MESVDIGDLELTDLGICSDVKESFIGMDKNNWIDVLYFVIQISSNAVV